MSVFYRFTLAFLTFCFVSFRCQSQSAIFSPEQKALIEAALRTAVVEEKNLEDYAKLPNQEKIILLDKMVSFTVPDQPPVYLTKEVVPNFSKVKFNLRSEAEIKKVKNNKDLVYLRLATIDQPESDYGVVTLLAQNKLGKKSRKKGYSYKEARGYTLLFKKESGTWRFQKVIASFPNLIDFDPGF